MKILNALIVDDEPLAHDILLTYCQNVPFINIVKQCYSSTEALDYMREQKIELVFLDINMPLLSGLDLLKVVKTKPQVIITSAHEEYALESYELSVIDYLLKPFSFERFLSACNKASKQSMLEEQANPSREKKEDNFILLKFDRNQVNLSLNDIYCLEAYGNYVKVWHKDICKLTANTLNKFEELLPNNRFVRIHKSFIINMNHIASIKNTKITLKNGEVVSIGRSYRKSFMIRISESKIFIN